MYKKMAFSKIGLNLTIIYTSVLSFIGYLLIYFNLNINIDQSNMIIFLSWMGILAGIYVIGTWFKLTGTVFSLYTIFMLFFFLFNYGQPLMWALGIHQTKEIGQTSLYTLGVPTTGEIALSQALTLICILLFHLGAIYSYKGKKRMLDQKTNMNVTNTNITMLAIYKTSFYLCFIVFPITFYNIAYKFFISQTYGYRSFYYNEEVVTNIVAFNLIENMFFPCLIGLLIGSNYRKKTRMFVYLTFAAYMILSVLSGDRGVWVYKLIILVWMSHTYFKALSLRRFLKYIVTGIIGLQILEAIVAVRNIGVSISNIMNALSFKDSAIISAVFEMGGSLRPTIVLMKYGWDIWPFGNTYVNALLGIVTSRTMNIIGREWAPLSDWFSQSFLGISYGAGFSIVAEALINYGPIFAPIFMIFLGFLMMSLTYLDKSIRINRQPLKIFFAVTTMSIFISVVRNHFLWLLKSWFYGVILFVLLILFVRSYLKGKKAYIKL